MKISEFVRLTINEICDGVMEAAGDVAKKTKNHPIAPAFIDGKANYQKVSNIDFEILVAVSKNSASNQQGGIGVNVSVISVDGKKTSQKEEFQERSAKINFSVPVMFTALKKPKNQPKTL